MKLNKGQKSFRKAALSDLLRRGGIVASDGCNMTAVFCPAFKGTANGHFALSCAGHEVFKRKYGEYVALYRFASDERLPISKDDFYHFCNSFEMTVSQVGVIRENDEPVEPPAI